MEVQLRRQITVSAATRPNLREVVAPLLDGIRGVMGAPRSRDPVCVVCGHAVTPRDKCMRLRGGAVVHCRCAPYDVRR